MFAQTDLLSDLISQYPQISGVLAKFEISLAKTGEQDLAGTAQAYGISPADLVAGLNEAVFGRQVADQFARDWSQVDATELIEYVVRRHHAFMHRQLPYLSDLLDRAKSGQLGQSTELIMLHAIFAAFKADIFQHMYIEEDVTFPLVIRMEQHRKGQAPRPEIEETLGGLDPFEHMEQEHQVAEESIIEIHRLMGELAGQAGTEEIFNDLKTAFADLETDIVQHIQLENDYLWPVRARKPR